MATIEKKAYGSVIYNSTGSEHLTDSRYIQGTYYVVDGMTRGSDSDQTKVYADDLKIKTGNTAETDGVIISGCLLYNKADSKFYQYNNSSWAEKEFGGGVSGPTSSTDNAIARFDGTTGKLIQNSGATIDDDGKITASGGTMTGDLTIQGAKILPSGDSYIGYQETSFKGGSIQQLDIDTLDSYSSNSKISLSSNITFTNSSYNYSYFTKLPTDGSTSSSSPDTIATREWVGNEGFADDADVVHKSGDTMTGPLRLTGPDNPGLGGVINFGDIDSTVGMGYCYIGELNDDILTIRGSSGIILLSDSGEPIELRTNEGWYNVRLHTPIELNASVDVNFPTKGGTIAMLSDLGDQKTYSYDSSTQTLNIVNK